MNCKAQRYKLYSNLQILILNCKWKNLSIDFVTRLPKRKDWQEIEYDLIFIIINRLIKMIYYKPLLTTINTE